MIDLRHIYYFIAASEQGSFRKAANILNVFESTISRRIRDLEDQLGASLFHRHSGGISLTVAGQRFLRRARIALRQIEDGINDVAAIGQSSEGVIKIGICSSLASGFTYDLLKIFGDLHPKIDIELSEEARAVHIAAIRQLKLDVALISGTDKWPDCESEQLWSECILAAMPTEHSLTSKSTLLWNDLIGEIFIVSESSPGPDIRNHLVQRLVTFGHHPNISVQSVGRDTLLSLVSVHRGLTVVNEAATGAQISGIAYRPIADETLPFSAVWSRRNDNPACRRFLTLARVLSRSERRRSGRI